jgi:transcriptional regulator with XRE-family HTH domain
VGGEIMELYKRIGKTIQEYREGNDMTQQQLGDKIGYTATAISYFENGLRKVGLDDLQKIANLLNIPIEMLLSSSEKDQNTEPAYVLKLRSKKNLSPTAQQSVIEFINFAKQKQNIKK